MHDAVHAADSRVTRLTNGGFFPARILYIAGQGGTTVAAGMRGAAACRLRLVMVLTSLLVAPFLWVVSNAAPRAQAATGAITAVGSLADSAGAAVASLPVSPKAQGDALLLVVKVLSPSVTVSSVTGGGSSWSLLEAYQDGGHQMALWLGQVTTTGSATISVTYSASVSGDDVELAAQEFSAGYGPSTYWSKDTSGGQVNASSTTVAFPSLTAAGQGELYFGYARGAGNPAAGSTAGFTYQITKDGNILTYDPAVSGTGTPTATMTPAVPTSAVGALVKASASAPAGPAVTGISPNSGPAAGGTQVTVTGTSLTGATRVSFGSSPATQVTVTSATSLTATSPAGSGTVDITVTTPAGTSPTSSSDTFTYTTPPSPAITPVGGLWDNVYASGGTTLASDPQAQGDVLVVTVDSHAAFPASSVSGGGVTTWNKAVQFVSARGHDIELWYGTVTTPGSADITFTWPSPGVSGLWTEYTDQEFSSGFGVRTIWSVDNGQAASVNGTLSTALPYPTLTPSLSGDLYYGFAGIPNNPVEGSTPGFTYSINGGLNVICYDTNVTSTVSPTASQSPAGLSEIVGALLRASAST